MQRRCNSSQRSEGLAKLYWAAPVEDYRRKGLQGDKRKPRRGQKCRKSLAREDFLWRRGAQQAPSVQEAQPQRPSPVPVRVALWVGRGRRIRRSKRHQRTQAKKIERPIVRSPAAQC